jgi:hypothetical protein
MALHAYYQSQGFEFCGFGETSGYYPSAALFPKETDRIRPDGRALLRIDPPLDG